MKKKHLLIFFLAILTLGGIFSYNFIQISPPGQAVKTLFSKTGPETDFYDYVNQAWLDSTEIPGDFPMYGVSNEVTLKVHERLYYDILALQSGEEKSDLPGMSEFLEFYDLAFDFDRRDRDGVAPIKPYLKQLEDISSFEDLKANYKALILTGMPLPFYPMVGTNPQNTDQKMMTLYAPDLILPDVSYYEDEAEMAELLFIYGEAAVELLKNMGYSSQEAQDLVNLAIEFDQSLVDYQLTSEEDSDIRNRINLRSPEEVAALSKEFKLLELSESLVNQKLTQININDLAYFEHLDQLVNAEQFPKIKAWMQVQLAMGVSSYLDEDSRILGGQLEQSLTGVEEMVAPEDAAYQETLDYFAPTLSTYYGQKYFGQKAKEQVTGMIDGIVAVYKDRLLANDWLSEETKVKAIEKLDKMTYFVGYPDQVDPSIDLYQVDPEKSLLDNIWEMDEAYIRHQYDTFSQPVDKTIWGAASYEVNAYYDPYQNAIIFPAGILEEPFFSLDQSQAQNYGAIGAVIGHEITHAFDSNGSLFDASGNMKDWWTPEDKAAFETKIQAMVDHFDGVKIYDGQVNGKLTVTENTADAGGLSSSLEALQRLDKDADLTEFFEAYARSWRNLVRPEFGQILLLDEHAPDKLRVNLQVSLLDAFYQTYQVEEGDPMYIPEDQRIGIW